MNLRPSGYEPDELPGCSTPRRDAVPGLLCRACCAGPGGRRHWRAAPADRIGVWAAGGLAAG